MPQPLSRTFSARRAVHESRWTRVTSLVAMPSVVVKFCVRCRVAESAYAQPRALAAAAAVRVPILITGAVEVRSPLYRNATPLFVGTARMVSFPDQLAYRRQTPSAPENARRSGNATRRVVPTNKGRRTTLAGAFFHPPGTSWMRSINQAPHADPELSRWCRARRPTRHLEQTPSKKPSHNFRGGFGVH